MLRGAMNDGAVGQSGADPFMPLAANLPELDDGINIADLDDSSMSDWLGRLSPNGMNTAPDELLSVTELLGLSGSGLIGAESDIELKSPEKFQDLRFTSTPKSKVTVDSGLGEESTMNKSIEYKVVLNDITDKLKADFFTSLSDVCEQSPNAKVTTQNAMPMTPLKRLSSADENKAGGAGSQNKVWERNVSIIRRRVKTIPACRPTNIFASSSTLHAASPSTATTSKITKRPRKKKTAAVLQLKSASCSKCSSPLTENGEKEISEEELLYYTGIQKHKTALGIVKFMRLPEMGKITPFKRIMITMMRLRFDFPFEDLGFRLKESGEMVRQIISVSSAVMGPALTSLIPWLEPVPARTQKRVYYLHEFEDPEMKVVVLLEDKSHLPICYVSDAYDPSFEGIHIVTATCPLHFAESDLICTFVADNPLFYRIERTETECTYSLAEGRFNEGAVDLFLTRNKKIMSELNGYVATDINRRTADRTVPYDLGVKICSALVNVNHLQEENLLKHLQQVFTRSTQAVQSHRPQV